MLKNKLLANIPVVVLILFLVLIQWFTTASGQTYYLVQLSMTAYYTIVALGLCLLMGYTGQISLGHGAFFAIGGYVTAVLTTVDFTTFSQQSFGSLLFKSGMLVTRQTLYGDEMVYFNPWLAFVLAILLSAVVALLIGYPALRLKGHYLAMATLGFGLIVYRLVLGSEITGGADGIQGVPPWPLGAGLLVDGAKKVRVQNFYIAWGFTLLIFICLLNLVHSRVGRALRAIHDGELAANTMGINTAGYKLRIFIFSAMLAAMAGCFLTHFNGGIGPSEAGAMKSIRYVALVAAGGMGNLWGVLITSTVITFLSLRGAFGTYDHVVFGIILIVIISFTPQGPLKPIQQWFIKRRKKRLPTEQGDAA